MTAADIQSEFQYHLLPSNGQRGQLVSLYKPRLTTINRRILLYVDSYPWKIVMQAA